MTLFKNKYRIETARLKGWNYASVGWYFITICTRHRQHFFGTVTNADMTLTDIGDKAAQFWQDIPSHFKHAQTDQFIVMPNHIHGILELTGPNIVETRHAVLGRAVPVASPPTIQNAKFGPLVPGSVSKIIQAYKAAVTQWCRKNNQLDFDWQPRFHDHIIRDDPSLKEIRQYIVNNPLKWELDQENQEGLWM
jgi:putative transposase